MDIESPRQTPANDKKRKAESKASSRNNDQSKLKDINMLQHNIHQQMRTTHRFKPLDELNYSQHNFRRQI